MSDLIISRRRALSCMAWAGAGIVWSMQGGIPVALGSTATAIPPKGGLSFVQISDTHIGFSKDANPDTSATTALAIERIRAMSVAPQLILHTGDVTHLSKPAEFDQARALFAPISGIEMHVVPGEHDVLDEQPGALFRQRFDRGGKGDGWYSFDHQGVHFIALINVLDLKAGGSGHLGDEQLAWLADDLKRLRDSTPIVVFTHIPLWSVYEPWGWATSDSGPALELLKRFGSVTVLNGHIHQVVQKIEGNVSFFTAMSTAYPQPHPGEGPGPGPLKVPAEQLRSVLGVREVTVSGGPAIAADQTLAEIANIIDVEQFAFMPPKLTIQRGTSVTWRNKDETPHNIVASDHSFTSPAIDGGESYTHKFDKPGTYGYFCRLHPQMVGSIVVT
jgi:Icc protein